MPALHSMLLLDLLLLQRLTAPADQRPGTLVLYKQKQKQSAEVEKKLHVDTGKLRQWLLSAYLPPTARGKHWDKMKRLCGCFGEAFFKATRIHEKAHV